MKDKCWEIPGNNQAVNNRKVNVADMQGIFFVLFMGNYSFLWSWEIFTKILNQLFPFYFRHHTWRLFSALRILLAQA